MAKQKWNDVASGRGIKISPLPCHWKRFDKLSLSHSLISDISQIISDNNFQVLRFMQPNVCVLVRLSLYFRRLRDTVPAFFFSEILLFFASIFCLFASFYPTACNVYNSIHYIPPGIVARGMETYYMENEAFRRKGRENKWRSDAKWKLKSPEQFCCMCTKERGEGGKALYDCRRWLSTIFRERNSHTYTKHTLNTHIRIWHLFAHSFANSFSMNTHTHTKLWHSKSSRIKIEMIRKKRRRRRCQLRALQSLLYMLLMMLVSLY